MSMNRSLLGCMATLLLLTLVQIPALACGESMFRVGFGITVPPTKVQNPATIAIFKASNSDPDVFFDDKQMSSRLEKVGHQVNQVSPEAQAGAAPQAFNVVIARANEIERAREALGERVTHAIFLPVYEKLGSTKSDQDLSLPSGATLRQILAVLQRAMQAIPS